MAKKATKKPAAKSAAGKKVSVERTATEKSKTSARPKRQAKNEFRYNNQTGHPNYVFEQEGNKYHSVGITHSPLTFGRSNMPLNSNPKTGEESKAYVRNGVITTKKKNYSKKPIKTMQFEAGDFKNVKSKIRHYKAKRKKKTNG